LPGRDVTKMKKNILLIVVLCISTFLSAQPFRKDDTVVVFKPAFEINNRIIVKYVPYKVKNTFQWFDSLNVRHKSVIRKINSHYLLLDTSRVSPSGISGLDLSPSLGLFPSQLQKSIPLITDSSGQFNIMTYYDFRILLKVNSYSVSPHHPDPFFRKVTTEQYRAALQRKKQRRIQHFAALDTCPLRYGIKTNLVRDLINEINLSIELPVTRRLCIDVGAGILYTSLNYNTLGYDEAFAQFRFLKSSNQFCFDHSYYNRKGFGIEVIPKFFISKKKILYLGPQLCFRYYHYQNKWVFLHDEGGDDYHRDIYAFQSEKSTAVHLNAMFGVQTPPIKIFLFDAFVSFGVMYRSGMVSCTIEKTIHHYYGTHIVNYDPPKTFDGGGFSLSGQIGLRMGFRFGKAKLYK
jgi:hypothetical protein